MNRDQRTHVGRRVQRQVTRIVGILACAGLAMVATIPSSAVGYPPDPYAHLPTSLQLTGVVRDFKERSVSGGHTDFERQPGRGFAHYVDICADELDEDGKPAYNGSGRKVTSQWRDSAGRNRIANKSYIESRSGDVNGAKESQSGNAVISASSFAQWWRDTPGVNMSAPLTLNLVRTPGTNMYTFNDRTDPVYSARGGFFPINGELFGNSGGSTPNRNHHFSFELDTEFVYDEGAGQIFSFTGDDDVFVFIDGKLVIDIGGVHGAVSQIIELDRLSWLEDGMRYNLKFFFTERHRTQSNFRIDTTINLEPAELPTTAALFD